MKFDIKWNCDEHAFQLFPEDSDLLCIVGNSDICLYKHHMKDNCYCNQYAFDYKNKENVLIGSTGRNNPFTMKRLIVYQMYETEEQNQNHEQQKREKKENQKQLQIETENQQLKRLSFNVPNKFGMELHEIGNWTFSQFGSIVFDSEICHWRINKSTFDSHVFGKGQLVFVIEDTNGNEFGLYLESIVDKYPTFRNGQYINGNIKDSQAFLFSFKRNGNWNHDHKQFPIKTCGEECAFILYKENDQKLFSIGEQTDLDIIKSDNKHFSCCKQTNSFDYNGYKNALMDHKTSTHQIFDIKRIQVWQMVRTRELQLKYERRRLTQSSEHIQNNNPKIIQQFYYSQELDFVQHVFDSEYCKWKQTDSTFDTHVVNKKDLLFVIEDTDNHIFGCYIHNKLISNQNDQINEIIIKDYSMFHFKFQQYDDYFQIKTIPIDTNDKHFNFNLSKENNLKLFSTSGTTSLLISKQKEDSHCYCSVDLFEDGKWMRIDNENTVKYQFDIKQIQVYQMKETDERKRNRKIEEKKRQDEFEEKEEFRMNQILSEDIQKYLDNIKKHFSLVCQDVLFDSDICWWKQHKSSFDKYIKDKEHVLILIEDTNNNAFGVYIESQIDWYMKNENASFVDSISDPNSFLFKLRTSENDNFIPKKYQIIKQSKQFAFQFYDKDNELLFSVGKEDIVVGKSNKTDKCHCKQTSFDDKLFENENHQFEVKRILAMQMDYTEEKKNEIEQNHQDKLREEQERISKLSNVYKELHKKEIQQIEEMIQMECSELLFTNETLNWKEDETYFDECLFGKQQLVFVIEDINENVFGGYIPNKIDSKKYGSHGIWKGKGIEDPNACVFTIHSQNNNHQPMIFSQTQEGMDNEIFSLMRNDHKILFEFGQGDIVIMKENNKTQCYCHHSSFDYKQIPNVFTQHDSKDTPFEVKRIHVWQMKNFNQQRIEERDQKIRNKLESLCEMKIQTKLFDSTINKWNEKQSEFDTTINEKEKLSFVIEDVEGNVFGCYINEKIESKRSYKYGKWVGESVCDPNAFIFSLQSNGRLHEPTQFPIKENKKESAFILYDKTSDFLFAVGSGKDILVMKQNNRHQCYCNQAGYDYGVYKNVLTGKNNEPFVVRRICVYQMMN